MNDLVIDFILDRVFQIEIVVYIVIIIIAVVSGFFGGKITSLSNRIDELEKKLKNK